MNEPRSVVSHRNPASLAEPEVRPRGLQLFFAILILVGMILIAIGVMSLISGMKGGNVPDARVVWPQAGTALPRVSAPFKPGL